MATKLARMAIYFKQLPPIKLLNFLLLGLGLNRSRGFNTPGDKLKAFPASKHLSRHRFLPTFEFDTYRDNVGIPKYNSTLGTLFIPFHNATIKTYLAN